MQDTDNNRDEDDENEQNLCSSAQDEGRLLPDGVLNREYRECHDAGISRINQRAALRSADQAPWYWPQFSYALLAGLLLGFASLVGGTWALWHWQLRFSDDWLVVAIMYANMLRVFFEAVAFYILATGGANQYRNDRAEAQDTTMQEVQAFLYVFWPYTDRLQRQMYRNDHAVERIEPPVGVDSNRQKFTEAVICGNLFRTISTAVERQPIQDIGLVTQWRSWFESEIVRMYWPYNREFFSERTVRFIEQNLFCDSPRPRISGCARFCRNPIVAATWIVTLVALIFIVWYWFFWVWAARLSLLERTVFFVAILDFYFVSLVVIFLAEDNRSAVDDAVFAFQHLTLSEADTQALHVYPFSVPWTQGIQRCNVPLQSVEIPPDTDQNEVLRYSISATRAAFQNVDTAVQISLPPEQMRFFRSIFGYDFVFDMWKNDRRFYERRTAQVVEEKIIPFRGCYSPS